MSLGKKTLREIELFLHASVENVRGGYVNSIQAASLLERVRAELKPKKFVIAAKKRVKAKKAERQDEWAQIREKVLARANGVCECGCGGVFGDSNGPEVDHFLGGSDRRTLQSVYTCWALTATHHREKTLNRPNRAFWLEAFIEHCNHLAYGVPEDAEICTGYLHAGSIAKAKLGSLRIQGRAE